MQVAHTGCLSQVSKLCVYTGQFSPVCSSDSCALSVYHQKSGHALPVDDWGSPRSSLHTAPNLWVNLGRSAFCSKRTKVGYARGLVTFKWPGYGIEEPCKALWTLFLACLAHVSGPPMVNRSRENIRDSYLNDSDEVLGFVAKLLIASNLSSITYSLWAFLLCQL